MKRSQRVIKWIENNCKAPTGFLVGKPIKLLPFQRKFIRLVYDNPNGTRTAILSIPRKNGKTTLIACLLLYHLCGPEALPNSELYSAARSREQAAIVFELAMKMVRLNPALDQYIQIRDTAKELLCPELGIKYKALSAEATTTFGKGPVFVIHDELGQVKGDSDALYDALDTAMGTNKNPLSIIISTQAPTDADLLSVLIDDSASGKDPRIVSMVYAVPKDSDPFDAAELRKANPACGIFQNENELFLLAGNAQRMPSKEPSFRNLNANQRVEAKAPFISRKLWESCKGQVVVDFAGPVYLGLDLSAVQDLTALVAISNIDGVWHVKPTAWLPANGLTTKAKEDRVPYDRWVSDGYLQAVPGRSIDYADLAAYVVMLFQKWNVQGAAFDPWQWNQFEPRLREAGMPQHEIDKFSKFGQGTQSMSPALRELETAILNQKLRHDGNPVLNWCMGNAVVTSKDESNRKLDKKKARGRIDLAVALTMAMGIAHQQTKTLDYTGKTLVQVW